MSGKKDMKRKLRTLWITDVKDNVFVADFTPIVNECAICRGALMRLCMHCEADVKSPSKSKQYAEILLMTLLMLQKRQETPFSQLDVGVLSLIYNFSLIGEHVDNLCEIVQLPCRHLYHSHCFEKWYAKRPHCPLDAMSLEYVGITRLKFAHMLKYKGELKSVIRTVRTYDEISNEGPKMFLLANKLVSIIKHTHGGLLLDRLCEIVGFDPTFTLDKLVSHKLIYVDISTNRYHYRF